MRKVFTTHYIYTFAVGILALVLVFSQPPLETEQMVLASRDKAEKALKAAARPAPVETVKPVAVAASTPKATGTVIQKQVVQTVSALPSAEPATVNDTTGSLTGLSVPVSRGNSGALMRVDADNLRMRDGPSSSAGTIATYPRDTRLEQMTVYGQWIQVRSIDDGTTGWMFADYLAPVE